ncbi:tail fiber domain-containing protein [Serratia oryzae]|uniref:Peptidase S74 domain-containing protein n=1 Tax=Serratia oryzae TaxID=2034155 RepID=A0A1S8CG78_9GAMM|nr:tail fiber domain-containing protein [Serratia oryzae]OMQ21061.1 hypothetical protein BMI79_15925 [Serratia oryzae]
MAEEKKNAQVLNGVNDDITELKSLSTLRKRVISDSEVVSKSPNGFRLANGNTGVILRNDGQDFYALTTPSGQAQDGQWNTLRPFSFNLATGKVSLRNGVEVSGGAVVSSNAGIAAVTTGPTALISGQIYEAPGIHTDFTSGNVTTSMLMTSRTVPGKDDFGILSYLDRLGNRNEIHVRANSEVSAGQFVKRNANGWILATGTLSVNNNADRYTQGVRIQGENGLNSELYHYERIGKHNLMGIHVANNNGQHAWYEFLHTGYAFANGGWNSSSDARMKTDIVKIDSALEKLQKIGGYTYLKQGVPEAGVIAQEVESVLPQSVTTTELKLNDGSTLKDARGININGVVALLIEALKEERAARIEDCRELGSRLAELEKATGGKQD